MGAFFQELPPQLVDENSERHLMTTNIHKVNLGVNMAYNMRHALTEISQTWKVFTLVLENSSNLEKKCLLSWNCTGIL